MALRKAKHRRDEESRFEKDKREPIGNLRQQKNTNNNGEERDGSIRSSASDS